MPKSGGDGLTAAERMMMKMGWKAGQGLGKQEQGITAPLMARKTDKRGGVIVMAGSKKGGESNSKGEGGEGAAAVGAGAVAAAVAAAAAMAAKKKAVGLLGPPTKVVLLRNMVRECAILAH